MSEQKIFVGTVPNDGTGDPLRTAFIKTESNFEELYGDNANVVNSILVLFTSSSNLTSAVNALNLGLGNTNANVVNVYTLTNSAFSSANQAGLLANTAGIYANAISVNANNAALAANNYAGVMANSINAYTSATYATKAATSSIFPNTTNAVFNGNFISSNGVYSIGNYTGPYTDGIVVDYVTGTGRISMGTLDGFAFYTGGVGTTLLTSISSTGILQTSNGFYSLGTFNGTFTDGIVVDYVTSNGRISVGGADAITFYNGGVAAVPTVTISASANLGIGFTSPAYKLDCNGAANISSPTLLVAGQNVLSSISSVKNRTIASQAAAYGLTLNDCGTVIAAGATIFVPNAIFYAGNTLYLYNNTATAITITQNTNTILRYGGLANTNRTLSPNGYATLTCVQGIESGANVFVLMGSGIT